jgi:hypothetical protein
MFPLTLALTLTVNNQEQMQATLKQLAEIANPMFQVDGELVNGQVALQNAIALQKGPASPVSAIDIYNDNKDLREAIAGVPPRNTPLGARTMSEALADMFIEAQNAEAKGPEPKEQPTPEPTPQEAPAAEPVQELTIEQVRAKVLKFVADTPGKGRDILATILQSFGANNVTTLAPEHYHHFLGKLEQAGSAEA